MIAKKLELTNEQTSPLFRIMWVSNVNIPIKRQFDNNISAFHIGNGFIISVAHNLRSESQIIKTIPEIVYQTEITAFSDSFQEFEKMSKIFQGLQIQKDFYGF